MWNTSRYTAGYEHAASIIADHDTFSARVACLRDAYAAMPDSDAVSEYEVGFRTRAGESYIDLSSVDADL